MAIFDPLNPDYAHYYSREEAVALLERAGFQDIFVRPRHGYSWSVSGSRP